MFCRMPNVFTEYCMIIPVYEIRRPNNVQTNILREVFSPIFAFASQITLVRRIASSISNAIYWMAETVQCLILSLSNFANRTAITTSKQAPSHSPPIFIDRASARSVCWTAQPPRLTFCSLLLKFILFHFPIVTIKIEQREKKLN